MNIRGSFPFGQSGEFPREEVSEAKQRLEVKWSVINY
jgi:hypothetical protein